jgi:hypothetical protein
MCKKIKKRGELKCRKWYKDSERGKGDFNSDLDLTY